MTTGNGITNIDIEKFFENETNDDLKKKLYGCLFVRFVITKYINFYKIIKEKEQNIHLLFSTLAEKINQERVGGAFLISIQKKTFYYSIALILLVLSNLLLIMTAQL